MKPEIVKRYRRGQVLRSRQQRQELLENFHGSGLSKAEFCRQHQIILGTFCQWLNLDLLRLRDDSKTTKTSAKCFAQLNVRLDGSAPIEIEVPSGVKVKLRDPDRIDKLGEFIRRMAGC